MGNRVVRLALIAAWMACLVAPRRAEAARGQDSAFGYQWRDTIDGATFDAIAFGPTAAFVSPPDNSMPAGPFALPFAFPFHGISFAQVWASDNGFVTLQAPVSASRVPQLLPSPAPPNNLLAPFWSDLRLDLGGTLGIGPDPTGTIERVMYTGFDSLTGSAVDFDVLAWESGCIQFQYRMSQPLTFATVGIENAPGSDAAAASDGGRPRDGFAIFPGQAVEFLPPASVDLACATATPLACGTTFGTSPLAGANVATWCCGNRGYDAHEAIYTFTLTEPTTVDLALTAPTALVMFLLESCNEHACLGMPVTATTLLLGAGTYFLVVDALSVAEEGPFQIDLACSPAAAPVACPSTTPGTTVGGASRWTAYGCAGVVDLSGPESVHLLDLAAPANIIATVTSAGADLDVLILRAGRGTMGSEDCIAWGDTTASAFNVPAGQYLVVVDGVAGDAGPYTLDVACALALTCAPADGSIDLGAMRAQTLSGDTTGGASGVTSYAGSPDVFTGPERVYEIVMPQAGHVVVVPESMTPGLSVFLADSCNEGIVVGPSGGGTCAMNLEAGTHYLVVDGEAAAEGPFRLRVAYEEPFRRWTSCQRPAPGTSATDRASSSWFFDDGAYCITEPTSFNYPDGCTFAMYVAIPCGGSPSIGHFDSESGHLRVFDVLAGSYVTLEAVSGGGWFMTGTDIVWNTSDCLTGSDPQFNDVWVHVSILDPTSPCGVFRIEYIDHSGSTWQLGGSCGVPPPTLVIHDDLAGGVAAHAPLPNLSIDTASVVMTCPDIEVSYTVSNTGCAVARNVEMTLWDGASMFASDIVPEVLPGTTVSRAFVATILRAGASFVLQLDAGNAIAECSESPGIACNVLPGRQVIFLGTCVPPCNLLAALTVSPSPACEGDALVVSGAGSVGVGCPGNAYEYQLTVGGVTVGPWQLSTEFAGLVAGASEDYTLEMRCSSDPACADSVTWSLDVELPPLFASARADDVSPCSLGIDVTWPPAVFRGPMGLGHYNIYRSTISHADALLSPPIALGLTGLAFFDAATMANEDYWYVVEAEDSDPSRACTRGPRAGGAVTRIEVPVVTDVVPAPETLPRVQGSLRLTVLGPSTLQLDWDTDTPIDPGAGEHFHVMRSDFPDSGFVQISTEPPPLQVTTFIDTDASAPGVQFYDVNTVDACEVDNSDYD